MYKQIYPQQWLKLNLDQSTLPLHFLDVKINIIKYAKGRSHFYTNVHDKKDDPKYALLPLTRYPHNDTLMSSNTLYNIILSQAHRYKGLCMRQVDFFSNLGKLISTLLRKGYDEDQLLVKCKSFFKQSKPLYSCNDIGKFMKRLKVSYTGK